MNRDKGTAAQGSAKHILLIYRRMIPSIRLCGHCQAEALAAAGRIEYRAVQGMRLKPADLRWADLVLLGRTDSWYEHKIASRLHRAGKTLVYIIDDDLLNVPPEVTSASYYNQKEIRRCVGEMIGMSDAVVSPSPLLLSKYAKDGRRAIRLEEPAIHPAPFTAHGADRPVKIGFAGSVDRTGDLEDILGQALRGIKQAYGDRAEFEIFGAAPSFAEEIGAKCIPYTRSYDDYRAALNGLNWDIGLAPMPATDFHACKHYNKFVEYAAAGIAGIFSDVPPYDRLTAFPGCAALCQNRTEDWERAIRCLMDDREAREAMRKAAADCAAGLLSVAASAESLAEALENLQKERPSKSGSGDGRFGLLLPLKAGNVYKRFLSSVRGHGAVGFVKHGLSLLKSREG